MERLNLLKDYIVLDDSYLDFKKVKDGKKYEARFKRNVKFNKDSKVCFPSFFNNKPISEITFIDKTQNIIGLYIPDIIEKVEVLVILVSFL